MVMTRQSEERWDGSTAPPPERETGQRERQSVTVTDLFGSYTKKFIFNCLTCQTVWIKNHLPSTTTCSSSSSSTSSVLTWQNSQNMSVVLHQPHLKKKKTKKTKRRRKKKKKKKEYTPEVRLENKSHLLLKAKLSPKSNQGFICDWILVKPLCKSIMTKRWNDERGTFKIYHIFVFGQANFQWECYGHFYGFLGSKSLFLKQ